MLRTRLAVAAAFSLTLLPGCGVLCGDRGLFGRSTECLRGGPGFEAIPVSYPAPNGACCTPIHAGGPMMAGPYTGGPYTGGPIFGGPVYPGNGLSETLPPPLAQPGAPRIPKAGIDEGKGKQFELEGASRSSAGGPVLAIPATGTK